MKRPQLNFLIDVIAFSGFVVLTATGVLMRFVLPPGSGHFNTIWGLDRHDWGDVHFWVSLSFLTILALHLILHWRWIVSLVSGKPSEASGWRAGLGIIGLLAAIALAISPLLVEVEQTSGRRGSPNIVINGSMTLQEIEQATGVPAAYIKEQLVLPETVSSETRLGILKREYDFEMSEVRSAVKNYNDK